MSSTMYTFIAAISDGRIDGDYRDWFRGQLAAAGFTLNPDGELWRGDDLVGRYRFVDPVEARQVVPSNDWSRLDQHGPFIGPVVGFFNWTHVADQRIAEEQLLPVLMTICRSTFARTDTGGSKDAVALVEFPLSHLLGHHGFSDGDVLLSRDDDNYLKYVQREAERALVNAGLSGDVGRHETHHNPIRLVGGLERGGRVVDDPESELRCHAVKIWAYDLEILNDAAFWID